MEYYKKDSNPLMPIQEGDIALGQLVYDNFGRCLQKVSVNEKILLVQKEPSVLYEDVLLSDLDTDLSIDLFWTLSRNKLKDGSKHKSK